MTLTEFLLARIAEDEADARREWEDDSPGTWLAWVLAECEAKRRIVYLHGAVHECVGDKWGNGDLDTVYVCEGFDHEVDPTLALFALPYADHPDYREGWRP